MDTNIRKMTEIVASNNLFSSHYQSLMSQNYILSPLSCRRTSNCIFLLLVENNIVGTPLVLKFVSQYFYLKQALPPAFYGRVLLSVSTISQLH